MNRRWIIRGFFIGLILLCVGGWTWSFQQGWHVTYSGRTGSGIGSHWGKIHLAWYDTAWIWGADKGIRFDASRADAANDLDVGAGYNRHYVFGFLMIIDKHSVYATIPYWFPTTLAATLLWLAWRKTRPAVNGRAFPVEAGKAV